jgi:uncharacterized protein YukE
MTDVGILGGDAVRGNPDGMESVSRLLRSTADELRGVRATLDRQALGGIWEGAAADAFRDLLQQTPEDLSKAVTSYSLASDAVGEYARRLRSARDTAQWLANQLADAQRRASNADVAVRAAQQAVTVARRAYDTAHDTAARSRAYQVLLQRQRQLASASNEHGAAHGLVDRIRRQAADNRRDLDNAARWAHDRLHEASVAGIRNSLGSWLDRNVGHPLSVAGHWAWKGVLTGGDIIVEAATLPWAIADWIKDPSFANFSKVLDHLSAALTVVGVVVMIAAAVGTGGAALAAAPAILAGLSFATSSAKLGVDAWRHYGQHDPGVGDADLLVDGLDVGTSALGLNAKLGAQGNWIKGIDEVDSTKWDRWATRVVIFNDGKPISNAALRTLMPESIGEEVAKEVGKELLAKQAKDWTRSDVPPTGKPGETQPLPSWLRNAGAAVKHSLHVPLVAPVPMAPYSWSTDEPHRA